MKRVILFLITVLAFCPLWAQNEADSIDDYYRLPFNTLDTFVLNNDVDSMTVVTRNGNCPTQYDETRNDSSIKTITSYVFNRGDTIFYQKELLTGYPEILYLSNDGHHVSRVIERYSENHYTDVKEFALAPNQRRQLFAEDSITTRILDREYHKDYYTERNTFFDVIRNEESTQISKYTCDNKNRLIEIEAKDEDKNDLNLCQFQYDAAGLVTSIVLIERYGKYVPESRMVGTFEYELNDRGDWVVMKGLAEGDNEVRGSVQRKIFYKK